MKKCFIMFVFFVVMLLIAAITDNKTEVMLSEDDVVSHTEADILLINGN